ncbi:MAG TPA: DUF6766 family protein [Candidatus Limnocylindrales bacterium]|nr:DUF6766 family protein [Candidatus Limnocylindrales bacterium]
MATTSVLPWAAGSPSRDRRPGIASWPQLRVRVARSSGEPRHVTLATHRRTAMTRWRRLWRDYSLSIVVAALFAGSFLLHTIFGWWQYVADQTAQGSSPHLWGWDGYVIYFGEWTFQNWQSEFLEVLLLIVATAYLIHKGSHESKDGEDEMKATLARIERRLEQLETGGTGPDEPDSRSQRKRKAKAA